MKILIEQYGYAKDRLSAILDPHYFTELRDGKAKIPYVGYFLSHKIPDMVFILPKVFIIDGKAFGEYARKILSTLTVSNRSTKRMSSVCLYGFTALSNSISCAKTRQETRRRYCRTWFPTRDREVRR